MLILGLFAGAMKMKDGKLGTKENWSKCAAYDKDLGWKGKSRKI